MVERLEGSAGHGCLRFNRAVNGSRTSTVSIWSMIAAFGDAVSGFFTYSMVNLTSSAVNSSPLWNLIPGLRLKSSLVGSVKVHSEASLPLIGKVGSADRKST